MKFEDIKDQAGLDALIAQITAEAIAGLAAKNDELLAKLAAAKGNQAPDDLDALKKAAADLESFKTKQMEEQGEYKKLLDTAREQHKAELEALTTKFSGAEAEIKDLLVRGGLAAELAANNINPVLLDAAVSLLSQDVSITDVNGKRTAQVGDKSLGAHVKEWAAGDVGKNFALAPSNTGGGAGGNDGAGGGADKDAIPFQAATWNKTEQAKLYTRDPKAYAALTEKYPSKDSGANAPQNNA